MSGKNKKHVNRTKGNVQPSSSARAAEWLNSSGANTTGFVGFGASTGELGYVPATTTDDDVNIDADFRMVMRKFSKKDSTTKLKALQEFAVLCKEKDADCVRTVLPFWPRVYCKLASDHDRRVRESTQQSFEQLVLQVRRDMAPHLKSLMGTWLVSQCDPYAPVASAAKAAFESAFPPRKQKEAIIYCRLEILDHFQDNFLNQTPQTLSDPKITDPEEMESKYQRVLGASLAAFSKFLLAIPMEQHTQDLIEKYEEIFSNTKFWKLAKSSNHMVRSSLYSVLSAFCHVQPNLANQFQNKIATTVLHNLNETEPVVCGALWEAVLYAVTNLQECWEQVSVKKGVLPKLWTMLKSGGNGSATVIYPNILPLLSVMPSDITAEETGFYELFFTNLKSGLYNEKVMLSPAESAAIVRAFVECIKFCVIWNITSATLVEYLTTQQLLPLVEATLVDKNSMLFSGPLCRLFIDFLHTLHLQSITAEDVAKKKSAKDILDHILDIVAESTVNHINTVDKNSMHILKRLGVLLISFKQPVTATRCSNRNKKQVSWNREKSKEKSKIDVDVLHDDKAEIVETTEHTETIDALKLYKIVSATCESAHSISLSCKSTAHLQLFADLSKIYLSKELVLNFITPESEENYLTCFVKDFVVPWMDAFQELLSPDVVTSFVTIYMTIFHTGSSPAEKLKVLDTILKNTRNLKVLHQILLHLHTHYGRNETIQLWFKGKQFGNLVLEITKKLCGHYMHLTVAEVDECEKNSFDSTSHWDILRLALSTTDTSELVLAREFVEQVIEVIQDAFPSTSQLQQAIPHATNECITFICDVTQHYFSSIKSCLVVGAAEKLLLSIFELSCNSTLNFNDCVTEKVRSSWQLGVCALVKQQGGLLSDRGFLIAAAQHLQQAVSSTSSCDRLCEISTIALDLADTITDSLTAEDDPNLGLTHPSTSALLKQLFMPFVHSKASQWQMYCLMKGQFFLTDVPIAMPEVVDMNSVPECLTGVTYSALLQDAVASSIEATNLLSEDSMMSSAFDFENIQEILIGLAFCRTVIGNKYKEIQETDLGHAFERLESSWCNVAKLLTRDQWNTLQEDLCNKSFQHGMLWSVAWQEVLKKTSQPHHTYDCDRFMELTGEQVTSLQALLPFTCRTTAQQISEVVAAQLLSCPSHMLASIPGGISYLKALESIISFEDTISQDGQSKFLQIDVLQGVLSQIVQWKQENDDLFIFDSAICKETWNVVCFNTELIRLLQQIVTKYPSHISNEHWDFILCSLLSWIQSCNESSAQLLTDPQTQMFATVVLDLLTVIVKFMQNVLTEQPTTFPPNLRSEWEEFFSEGAFEQVLPLFVSISSGLTSAHVSITEELLLESLSAAAVCSPLEVVLKHKLPPRLTANDDGVLPDNLQSLLNHLSPLLLCRQRVAQLAAYRILLTVIKELPSYDESCSLVDHDKMEVSRECVSRSPPTPIMSILEVASEAVTVTLQEKEFGEHTIIPLFGDEQACTMGYLLSWKLILGFFRAAPSMLRAEYAMFLKERNLISKLLHSMFCLLPENALITLTDSLVSQPTSPQLSTTKNMFADEPLLEVKGGASVNEIQHVACSVYAQTLKDLPALLRQWFNSQDKKTTIIVDRYTSKFVSPILCAQEMSEVGKQFSLDNMVVKVRPVAREVVAIYTVEEVSMELVISLASNHPLGSIKVDSQKRVGVNTTQWRNWMLQLTTYLMHQNGSILHGLSLWKQNVDKRFEGVEDCMICFSVIHGQTCQLPKLQCRTCKKKFHSACLYKWFHTSNKSTCPLCRNLF